MTFDEIIEGLSTSEMAPAAMLHAAVAYADRLAPRVFAIAEKLSRGVYLMPRDTNLLFHGLNILAAAKHPGLLPHIMALAQLQENELEGLFPGHVSVSLARLWLSVWDGDADALFDMVEHDDLIPDVKWALFDVVARLTFDGHIPRDRTIAFLERLERDDVIGDGDMTWWGWEEAVTKLGVTSLVPALRRVWAKVINENHSDRDHAESLDQLKRAAADPTDAGVFDEEDVRPIDDPVEAVSWVEFRAKAVAKWHVEVAEDRPGVTDDDPAKAVRLTPQERDWLAGFLVSQQAPDSAMSFEMVDGLLTALVIGPSMVPPSRCLPAIWGADHRQGPDWDSVEQAEYFMGLVMKHWNAIAARRNANAPHDPLIEHFSDGEPGRDWAMGFAEGIALAQSSWEPMFKDREAAPILMSLLALVDDDPEVFEDRVTPEVRREILDQLPIIIQIIAAYWRDGPPPRSRQTQLRSTKVGRNELCPCGSGKKFKRCCGANPPTLH